MRLAVATLAALLLVCSIASANPIDKYERVAEQVWGQPIGPYDLQWTHGKADTHAQCGYPLVNQETGKPEPRIAACAAPGFVRVDWEWWQMVDKYDRCVLWAHEAGHRLPMPEGYNRNLDHDQPWFRQGERRAGRLCIPFMPKVWRSVLSLRDRQVSRDH
jgi:hypothetical protein